MVVNWPDIDHRHRAANAECRTIRDAGSAKATVSRVSVSCAADRDAGESRMQEELVMLEPAGPAGSRAEDQLKQKNGEINGADQEGRAQTLWRIGGGLCVRASSTIWMWRCSRDDQSEKMVEVDLELRREVGAPQRSVKVDRL